MQKQSRLQVVNFFYRVIFTQSFGMLSFIFFSSVLWGLDANIRSFIVKQMTDQLDFVDKYSVIAYLTPYIIVFFASLVIRFIILRISSYMRTIYLIPNCNVYIINYFIKHFISNADVTDQKSLGNYSNKVQEFVSFFQDFFNLMFVDIICHFIALSFALVSFYYVSPSCFYCLVGLMMFFILVSLITYNKQAILSASEIQSSLEISAQFNDIISNIFHVKTLNNQKYESFRFDKFTSLYRISMKRRNKFNFIVLCLLSCIFILYHPVCLMLLLWQFENDLITKGSIAYIIMLNIGIPEYLWSLVDDVSTIAKLIGKSSSVLSDLILPAKVKFHSLEMKSSLNKYDIAFRNVYFNYSDNKVLFENLSFNISSNSKVGIIGYSGSGKSSIISLLLRLRDPDNGAIYIDGENIMNFSNVMLNSLITVMTQDVALFNRTIYENISYSNNDASQEQIEQAAKLANIHDFIETLPLKYNTLISSNGKEFSYGQRQRLLIARAFLRNSPILLLDEITASLDNKSEEIVLQSLNQLMVNRTVIVIAHKLYTLKNMDKLIMLNNGRVVCEGPHEELLKNQCYIDLLQCAQN